MLYIAQSNQTDPYYNLALEEYLLSQVPEQGCILYLWQNDHTVVIGRNQNAWTECRLSQLQEDGGHLARRLSGGGAVYHDLGNLNFTFLCREENYDLQKQLSVIQKAVSYCGIRAEFSGRNDLLACGKKFSGNAFYHSQGKAYHHGTLLIHTDTERLTRYLSPPKAKLQSKGIASVRSRVVNLRDLSPTLTCDLMRDYMIRAFAEIYGEKPIPFTAFHTEEICKTKYESTQWLYGKQIPFSCTLDGHFSFGSLQLHICVEEGIITATQCYTDAMDSELPQMLASVLNGCVFQTDAICQSLSSLAIADELIPFIQNQL